MRECFRLRPVYAQMAVKKGLNADSGKGEPEFTDLGEEEKLNRSLVNKHFVQVDHRDQQFETEWEFGGWEALVPRSPFA